MGGARRLALVLGLTVLVAVGGCGGGDDSTTGSGGKGQAQRLYPWLEGPTREFLVPGGDNIVQTYGREASKAEREQASRVIAAWMRARAAEDWKKACSYMSASYRRNITVDANGVTDGRVKSCPEALAYFGPEASGDGKNNLTGPIDSFRVEEGLGFAQYHGNDGRDWVVPMNRENGKWKVSTATPIDRMK
jgi:hypothetical protein